MVDIIQRFKEDFDKCENLKLEVADQWRWRILLNYRGRVPYTVHLDNDDTFVTICDEDDEWVGRFDNYIGNRGAHDLLATLGINAEDV